MDLGYSSLLFVILNDRCGSFRPRIWKVCSLLLAILLCHFASIVVKAFQEYVEPEEGYQGSPQRRGPSGQEDENVTLPLGDNVLTHNLGIPVIVVCTKVSLIARTHVVCVLAPRSVHFCLRRDLLDSWVYCDCNIPIQSFAILYLKGYIFIKTSALRETLWILRSNVQRECETQFLAQLFEKIFPNKTEYNVSQLVLYIL